jgi:hypothetical protein
MDSSQNSAAIWPRAATVPPACSWACLAWSLGSKSSSRACSKTGVRSASTFTSSAAMRYVFMRRQLRQSSAAGGFAVDEINWIADLSRIWGPMISDAIRLKPTFIQYLTSAHPAVQVEDYFYLGGAVAARLAATCSSDQRVAHGIRRHFPQPSRRTLPDNR